MISSRPGPKVLFIDDEPDTLRTYSDILDAAGYNVTTAQTGEEALALLNGYLPDIILLDVMLPGKGGLEVARELSQRQESRDIPIVAITALATFPDNGTLEGLPGIRRVVYKPCRPRTLLESIEEVLRYRRQR